MLIFYITDTARVLGEKLLSYFPGASLERFSPQRVRDLWPEANSMVFIMATGIVVRTIGPLLHDKKTDPAVLVMDEQGRHVISLTGGHLGGANTLAEEISALTGATPVLTTASDLKGLPGLDLWASEMGLEIEAPEVLPKVMRRFVEKGTLRVFTEEDIPMPEEFIRVSEPGEADIIITVKEDIYLEDSVCPSAGSRVKGQLYLRPKRLVAGMGFNTGTPSEEMLQALEETFRRHNLSMKALSMVATLDKKARETTFREFVNALGLESKGYTVEELNACVRDYGIETSEAASKATGAMAVAEPSAVLASGGGQLIVPKEKFPNVTVAVALATRKQGKLFVVGVGPGSLDELTPRARQAGMKAGVIVGYRPYLERLMPLVSGKELYTTGMTKEIDRCRKALEYASGGRTVALVSSGDPGIYAMAGLVFELMRAEPALRVPVEVVPGVSALNACSARLGAPLMNDFAVVSLSDRLTPWERIEDRLHRAAEADFVIVLFNPRSRGRPGHLKKAVEIIKKYRPQDTPVGIVKAVSRENEKVILCSLGTIPYEEVDMESLVVVGNSMTFRFGDFLVTPRGYGQKYEL